MFSCMFLSLYRVPKELGSPSNLESGIHLIKSLRVLLIRVISIGRVGEVVLRSAIRYLVSGTLVFRRNGEVMKVMEESSQFCVESTSFLSRPLLSLLFM